MNTNLRNLSNPETAFCGRKPATPHLPVIGALISQIGGLLHPSLIPVTWLALFYCSLDMRKKNQPEKIVAKVSQEVLAEMIGTTRSRGNLFMNKLKRMGFIRYNGGLHIDSSLLSIVLHD